MKLDVYYSYACRESYLLFAWLKQVEKSGQALEIQWHPFAIQTDDWNRSWAEANSELRGFIAAGAALRQGSDRFDRFHGALELAVHEQSLELGDESTLIGVAERARLDMVRFQKDLHDPQLVLEAQRSHQQAVERWNISGTPTIVFRNGRLFHIELRTTPREPAALEWFRAIETLATAPIFSGQLRATFPV